MAECRLALVLAVDISSSVDAAEDALQRGGIAAALQAPEVQAAFLSNPDPVALAICEWSGRYNQEILLDWTLMTHEGALNAAAQRVAESKRSHNDFPTAMGHAVLFASSLLRKAPPCDAQTIDVAGDGQNNDGFSPLQAYEHLELDDVTVNGLVVNAADYEAETGLIAFYKAEVIRGPGAFIEIAQGFDDYARAMRKKLEREVSAPVIGKTPSGKAPKG